MSRFRPVLSLLLLAAILAAGWAYYVRHPAEFHLIRTLSWPALALLFAAKAALAVLLGWQLKIVTDAFGLNLPFSRWFGLSRAASLTGLFLPFPGAASVKAVYLKRLHGFRYGSFIAGMTIAGIVKFAVVALGAMLVLLPMGRSGWVLLSVSAVFLAGSWGFLLLAHRCPARWFAFWPRLEALTREWGAIRSDRRTLGRLLLASAAGYALVAVSVGLSFRAFSTHASPAACLVIASFMSFTGTLKLVPGDVGSREFFFILIAGAFSVGVNESLHAAALHRIAESLVTLLLAPSLLGALGRRGEEAA